MATVLDSGGALVHGEEIAGDGKVAEGDGDSRCYTRRLGLELDRGSNEFPRQHWISLEESLGGSSTMEKGE